MSLKRVYIVRHGETDYNVEHRWQGQLDVPLNKAGKRQAKALAQHLADISVDAIFSSDLKRTMDTIRPYVKQNNLTITPEKRLREIHLGDFQGLKRHEIRELYPQEAMRWDNDDSFVIPNGESRQQVKRRILTFWQETTQRTDLEQIMMVSHGGSIRILMHELFPEVLERFHFANTSITVLECDEHANWKITALNTIPHLNS